jgi:hypothetical protein
VRGSVRACVRECLCVRVFVNRSAIPTNAGSSRAATHFHPLTRPPHETANPPHASSTRRPSSRRSSSTPWCPTCCCRTPRPSALWAPPRSAAPPSWSSSALLVVVVVVVVTAAAVVVVVVLVPVVVASLFGIIDARGVFRAQIVAARLSRNAASPPRFALHATDHHATHPTGPTQAIQQTPAQHNTTTTGRYNEDLRSTSKAQQLAAFVHFCAAHMTATPGNCDVLVAAFFEIVPVLKDFTPVVTRLLEDTDEVSGNASPMCTVPPYPRADQLATLAV